MALESLRDELNAVADRHGIERLGVCSADVFVDVRAALHERKAAGLSADMQFTYRNPDRSTDPQRALPGARSVVVAARSYRRSRPTEDAAGPLGRASIAEYVWEPHYAELKRGLDEIAATLVDAGYSTRVLVDDNALVDRAAAYRAGIGWWGKNSNILIPGLGSKFVLGSVVTTAELTVSDGPIDDQCGSCRRCFDGCPTDAIVADGVIDSRRCLAWLVQSPGSFPIEFRDALGDRIYGCDDCQTVCPPNTRSDRADPPAPTSGATTVELIDLLDATDDELMNRFGAWYIPRREPRYLRRNALIVLGNVADGSEPKVQEIIDRYVGSDDEIEREHAEWAAAKLGLAVPT